MHIELLDHFSFFETQERGVNKNNGSEYNIKKRS